MVGIIGKSDLKCIVDDLAKHDKAVRTAELAEGPFECVFLPEHIECEVKKEKKSTTTFMPGVVEPSFCIDRILFSTLEHAFYVRSGEEGKDDDKSTRAVLAFPGLIAPYKVTLLPLDQRLVETRTLLQ